MDDDGLTTGETGAHCEEIYGTEVSRETISKITEEIVCADCALTLLVAWSVTVGEVWACGSRCGGR